MSMGLDAALRQCARPLVVLATAWQGRLSPDHPPDARAAAVAAVERFERGLAQAGADVRTVAVASYVLCVWLDEGLAAPDRHLLRQFHGEADGSVRAFELLERLLADADANQPLLGLFHTALSLGLRGRWRDTPEGPRRIEALRQRLATALRLDPTPLAAPLSAHWQPAPVPRRPGRERRFLASGLLGLALVGVMVYSTSQVLLARQVDEVFASLQGLEPAVDTSANVKAAAGGASGPVPDRLVSRLAGTQAEGLRVQDEPHRSQVVLPADGLFSADTAQLQAGRAPLLARIGQALAAQPGRVLVRACARTDTPRPARLVSASQLADAWAQQVAQALQPHLAAGRVVAEGCAPVGPAADGAVARVEITLFP
jgi:type VI secretion system protein ImpK